MKKSILFLLLFCLGTGAYSYTAKMDIFSHGKELKVQVSYIFSNSTVNIEIPKRGKMTSISSPGKANVAYYNSENKIRIDNVISDYAGKINIVYTLIINEPEYYREDWLARCDEKGSITAGISVPKDYKGFVIPYTSQDKDGFTFEQDDNPVLVVGKYKYEDDLFNGTKYEVYYQFKLFTPVTNISSIYQYFINNIAPLDTKNVVLITLPAIQTTVRKAGNSLFVVVNNTTADEIKKALAGTWFRNAMHLDDDYTYAFSDVYRRLIDDNGAGRKDAAYLAIVPDRAYYDNVLLKGFGTPGEINCSVNDMLKNFAMIHFAYYTIGVDNFISGTKNYYTLLKQGKTNYSEAFASLSNRTPVINFVCNNMLPVSKIIPDLSVKGQFVYRNNDQIPDITAAVNGETRPIVWGNKRVVDLGNLKGFVSIDTGNLIPQLNFYNDKAASDPAEAAEWKLAYEAIIAQRHYPNESSRELIDIQKFEAPVTNAFSLVKGTPVYIGIVKFAAPVHERLVICLKEVVVAINSGKAVVIADRIRL
jgi:hypothetical protein